ncbi:hypothetical protein HQQ94_20535 [Shewanella sp. VB17]|uniref:hypothetical protein n=1 Tax=Shewanella sp. VB17 TaxID=2739432 RepID=UPI0015665B05|nr:hypothetical protein [Shewanella sp. VB17]NRD75562.1 hypothetical protein [Shewanella sp. VB17]
MQIKGVLHELSRRWKVDIPTNSPTIIIQDNQQKNWYIDCPTDSSQLVIYTFLLDKPTTFEELSYWFSLNGNRSRMQSAWIAEKDEQILLGISMPVEFIDANLVENLMNNLHELSASIMSDFHRHVGSSSAFLAPADHTIFV